MSVAKKVNKSPVEDGYIAIDELAAIFDCSNNLLNKNLREGIFTNARLYKNKKYFHLQVTVNEYVTFLRKWQETHEGSYNLALEKARKEHYLASKAQKQLQVMSGELVEAKRVEREAYNLAKEVRDKLLGLPNKIAPMVIGLDEREAAELA